MNDRRHFVYRAYADDGRLLYVGRTGSPKGRHNYHRARSNWYHEAVYWRLDGPLPKSAAMELERVRILQEAPAHNVRQPQRGRGPAAITPAALGFITTAEACDRLGHIDRSTISRWVQTGRITPAHQLTGLRGAFLFDPAEVERLRLELLEQTEASA